MKFAKKINMFFLFSLMPASLWAKEKCEPKIIICSLKSIKQKKGDAFSVESIYPRYIRVNTKKLPDSDDCVIEKDQLERARKQCSVWRKTLVPENGMLEKKKNFTYSVDTTIYDDMNSARSECTLQYQIYSNVKGVSSIVQLLKEKKIPLKYCSTHFGKTITQRAQGGNPDADFSY